MVGTLSLSTIADVTTGVIVFTLTNLALTSTRDGKTDRLSNARFERRFDVADRYDFDFAGTLDSELLGGRYSFSTPIRFTGGFGLLPQGGELESVAGRTSVKLAVSSVLAQRQSMVDYQVDTGSGYGPPSSARWRDVTTGLLFYWFPNDPPVISSLEIVPAAPSAFSVVTAYTAATDPDGDRLTFQYSWTIGQSTYSNSGPAYTLGGLPKGTIVSVTVKVSDGRAEVTRSLSFIIGNTPPVITSLTVDPPAPRSADDLTVTAVFEDYDRDALAVRYEWQKNGATIPGATGAALPRSAYAKNDVVTATAYVNDGSITVSQQATVTIGDSPAQLTFLSPPPSVQYGAPLSVTAHAVDPDGDALPPQLQYVLRYGPAGMTVNASTGVVQWVPSGPMFDKTMDVAYSVGLNVPGAGVAAATVTVEDADRQYPLARSSMDAPRFGSLRAGDFDGDGDFEVLALGSNGMAYELARAGTSYQQSWVYPFPLGPIWIPVSMAAADIDGDGRHEIFVASRQALLRLDGVERRVAASVPLPLHGSSDTCVDLELADLDRDGSLELVCSIGYDEYFETDDQPILIFDPLTLAIEAEIAGGRTAPTSRSATSTTIKRSRSRRGSASCSTALRARCKSSSASVSSEGLPWAT
jgi:hypothetical protein